ncbi:inosine triphosphate pyrophosphatase [Gregarina niphandrodes]|uniref:XTP/dITP diphosphatase n=1 Tax=Gregarina niphandrodes TaxID=110365 RepID=A0A023B7I1_GRENI|nr:inosine triphosphate pyrophosphatase [Gregarina niphandrodes]EZG67376.1 inosine triphosphate pyrophosphatase [Gregarina niphandrodes]|eukprot:XP_011130257.1 inosine triphosphate pyrophosphatase [Gregarina niphandrodes]
MKIYFVTGNENKRKEVERLIGGSGVEILARAADVPEFQGNSRYITTEKCRWAFEHLRDSIEAGSYVMTEDTSLGFDAMGGLPGPYIRWFLEELGNEGLTKMLVGFEDKGAEAKTTMCLMNGCDEPLVVEGVCHGQIVEPRGPRTFGWDANFQPDIQADSDNKKTYAEMSVDEKGRISHRGNAMQALKVSLLHTRDCTLAILFCLV